MALLISTNMYKAEEFKRVLPYVEKWRGQVGVEVFPMFHQQIFAPLLEESTDILSRVPISFHGPYYKAEHSAPQGTPEYEYTMELVEQTLHYSEKLNSRYMVFHHNNFVVQYFIKTTDLTLYLFGFIFQLNWTILAIFLDHNLKSQFTIPHIVWEFALRDIIFNIYIVIVIC